MPKSTLEKARKAIKKKKNGTLDALHENSRNARRLHKAQIRDERLDKQAILKQKFDKPLVHRVVFFQEWTRANDNKPYDLEAIQSKIKEFVRQYDEEYNDLRSQRRPGRPASSREDLLKAKIEALEKEHRDGFYMPDLTLEKNTQLLDRWEDRNWAFLSNLTWVKVSSSGVIRPSNFPPQHN